LQLPGYRMSKRFLRNWAKISGKLEMIRESNRKCANCLAA
jgi:hypothetical protein